jgi:hypothetical protein
VYPFNDKFDAGQVGVMIAPADKIRKVFGVKHITKKVQERVKAALEAEIQVYNNYLHGEVWGYVFTDDKGEEDSCWGFFGSTLEETGLETHVPSAGIPLLKEAWERRKT